MMLEEVDTNSTMRIISENEVMREGLGESIENDLSDTATDNEEMNPVE